jgi:hypothetical protein
MSKTQGLRIDGRYANFLCIGHNAYEFVLDFGQLFPESEDFQPNIRIITGPAYAKGFLATLQDAIERYERRHGPIPNEAPDSDSGN